MEVEQAGFAPGAARAAGDLLTWERRVFAERKNLRASKSGRVSKRRRVSGLEVEGRCGATEEAPWWQLHVERRARRRGRHGRCEGLVEVDGRGRRQGGWSGEGPEAQQDEVDPPPLVIW